MPVEPPGRSAGSEPPSSRATPATAPTSGRHRQRRNLADGVAERWPPPIFTAASIGHGPLAALRRYFDLQAGSIWRDLAEELATVEGLVVDVGCGAQPYRALLPAAASYLGIDTKDAGHRFGYEHPDTLHYDGATWPVPDGSAGTVLCTETLEHVLDPRAFLREAARCLEPGGTLILTVPFAARWHFIPHDYWRFTPSGLNHLLEAAGFRNTRVHARGNELTVACYKTMALFIPLLVGPAGSGVRGVVRRLAGVATLPLSAALAVVANISLNGEGGEDCLGYTVVAQRAAPE